MQSGSASIVTVCQLFPNCMVGKQIQEGDLSNPHLSFHVILKPLTYPIVKKLILDALSSFQTYLIFKNRFSPTTYI